MFQIASICDIVLNHTANESKWIYENPEASYSSFTTHHLRPAILLDAMLAQVSADVAAGLLTTVGVPEVIENDDHLQVFVGLTKFIISLFTKYPFLGASASIVHKLPATSEYFRILPV